MSRHTLRLITVAMLFSVTPALADQASATKPVARHCCPKKHAQAAAASGQVQQVKGATTITLPDRVPAGSLLDFGFRRGIFTP